MGRLSPLRIVDGAIIVMMLMLGCGAALAQSPAGTKPPAVEPLQSAAPARNEQAAPPSRQIGKTGAAQPNRKYERSYRQCKARALKRGLRGAERRSFIRRCELGFAPPKAKAAPAATPADNPVQPQVAPSPQVVPSPAAK